MTTLTLAFTEDFNAVAGRLREIGAKFTTRGSGATRTLVFSNMPESVLSLIRQWIERSSEAPVAETGETEPVAESETPEPEAVNNEVAESESVEADGSETEPVAGTEIPEALGVDETETEEIEEAIAEGTAKPKETPEPVEGSADSPRRHYDRSELEEMTVKAILSLAGELAIDLSPVVRKRKPEIIARFLLFQG